MWLYMLSKINDRALSNFFSSPCLIASLLARKCDPESERARTIVDHFLSSSDVFCSHQEKVFLLHVSESWGESALNTSNLWSGTFKWSPKSYQPTTSFSSSTRSTKSSGPRKKYVAGSENYPTFCRFHQN